MQGKPNATFDVSFDEFILAYMKGKKPGFADVGSQLNFMAAQPNGTGITHYFRYENQDRLKGFLEQRLDVTLDLKQENVSPQMDLHISPEIEQRFKRKFADEFSLYDSIE